KQPNLARTKELTAMGRHKLRMGIGLLTGHLLLRAHLYNIGLADQKNCRLCGEENEDSIHLLCRCPLLACKRYRSWSNTFLMSEDLDGAKIDDLISLVHGTGLG
ncbi:hypothetical protein ALC60_01002, partial [Trachymyrmex zeteki]